jgi:hypothetical protein
MHVQRLAAVGVIALVGLSPTWAQTRIAPDKNKYSPAQDVELGQKAAAEVRRELPMLNDDRVDDYVEDVGRRLVAAIPAELRHSGFRYSFEVVNQKEINAFALPGGPMFLNRGMMEAAKTEGEMVGVMAHEISHVALRHGTAQATKGERFQLGALAGQVLGAVIGGTAGSIIAQGSQFGLGTYFLKFGREYERQADLLGAQIMARAGYDPRQMANMFRTIEAQGGSNGPEWLSSHPNPGNRYEAINREAGMLQVNGSGGDSGQFESVKRRLAGMSPAYTAEQIARGQARSNPSRTSTRRAVSVPPPSGQFRTHQPAQFLRVSVPANWDPVSSSDGVTYAPEGGVLEESGRSAFTHGVQLGVVEGASGNLQRDTDQLLQGFARANPDLRRSGGYSRVSVGGRQGLTTTLSNVSDVTGQREYVNVTTAPLRGGRLLFVIGVAPDTEADAYAATFARIRQSVRIAD